MKNKPTRTKEENKIYMRKWRKENPEKARKIRKKHYDANRKKCIALMVSWQKRNPEKTAINRIVINKNRREKRKANIAEVRAADRKWKYGITPECFQQMLQEQRNLCAVCFLPETIVDHRTKNLCALAVDHNHETGVIRGLLCRRCNMSIGMVKEDLHLLRSIIQYLEKHNVSR